MNEQSSPQPQDEYEVMGRYYEASYGAKSDLVDLDFYLDIAKENGGPVLEIACGTGRILLPIARAGVTIDGVDLSGVMLGFLRGKLAAEPPEVQSRVTLHEGDMRTLSLGKRYRLVTSPFRPFQHLYTFRDQLAGLRTARDHLTDDGQFVFDVFQPRLDIVASGIGEEKHELEWTDPDDPSLTVRRAFKKTHFDPIDLWFSGEFIFRSFRGDELVREERSELKMSFYTYPHLRLLIDTAGLEVVNEYGGFDRCALRDGREFVFVLKKK